ncbi:ROK family transcriptional regulator [Bacteroides gallinarum]|uniref:ROK family transcriptional regulator n=1 Tax=Bacteroides gallinarum TaxID=376806 RepID=UPI000380FA7A|nr:ROK family transcriptional regulator [Bacteroides gallinarum]
MDKLNKINIKCRKETLRDVLVHLVSEKTITIPQIAKDLDISLPTATKIINKLQEELYIISLGKLEKAEGRPPVMYTLNPQAGFFIGVNIKRDNINIGLSDFCGEILQEEIIDYPVRNTNDSLIKLCWHIKNFIQKTNINTTRLLGINLNISGRVNPFEGRSYSLFSFLEDSLREVLEDKLGHPVSIENDTRAMLYGELYRRNMNKYNNVSYVNISWGIGMAFVINGTIITGKSGFSGEFGHFQIYNNEILCHCGKKGCLETEISGAALYRRFIEEIKSGKSSILSKFETITLNDIISAINNDEDPLCLDLIEDIGRKLGKQLANIINLLNPELIIVGGELSKANDYLLQPLKTSVKKYTLNLVNKDVNIIISDLKDKAGVIGACLLARDNFLGILTPLSVL